MSSSLPSLPSVEDPAAPGFEIFNFQFSIFNLSPVMNWNRLFILLSGGVLFIAAALRFFHFLENGPLLSMPDPALGLPLRYTTLAVGALELLVALICLLGKSARNQLTWLAWLATDYLAFRICLILIGVHPQNTCIGALTDPLHLSRSTTGLIISLVPVFLLLYSYSATIYLWRRAHSAPGRPSATSAFSLQPLAFSSTSSFKMSCPNCGIHIRFASENAGQTTSCPQCSAPILLRDSTPSTIAPTPAFSLQPSAFLRTSCLLCSGHIEFPADGLGQTISCPHCKMTTTL